MPKLNRFLSTTKLVLEIFYITFECFPTLFLMTERTLFCYRCHWPKQYVSGTGFIIWKQEGLRARGRSLRITLYKGIAKHGSSQSPAMMFYYSAVSL